MKTVAILTLGISLVNTIALVVFVQVLNETTSNLRTELEATKRKMNATTNKMSNVLRDLTL